MRNKTHELLEDYLKQDIKNLRSDEIRNFYQKVSDGELSPEFFAKKVRERKNASVPQMRLFNRGRDSIDRDWALNNPLPGDLKKLDPGY